MSGWEKGPADVSGIDSGVTQLIDGTIVITGTSPGGNTVTSIVLDALASTIDGHYDPGMIVIYEGTGCGQARQIYQYNGTTRTAYVSRDWKETPDTTSKYMVKFFPGNGHVNEGVAQGGGVQTITLNELASSQNNVYLGQMISLVAGTGSDQARMVIGYDGTTKIATMDSPWIIQPDNTTIYITIPFPGFTQGRASLNSTDNILMRDIMGNKNDFVQVPYTFGIQSLMAHLNTSYYHVHGQSFVYPNHANDVILTSGAGAWGLGGSIIEIIPASTLSLSAFDLHWINISNIGVVSTIQIDIYSGGVGSEVLIGATRASRTTNQERNGPSRIQIPQQTANTRISCRLSDSTAGTTTCEVSFEGHYYA